LASKTKRLLIPRGGGVYVPELGVPVTEVQPHGQCSSDGLKITAVPVKHAGFRFGADAAWVTEGYTGWVIEYNGLTVYFAGDTAFERRIFEDVARRFPKIDVALMPIGPVEPPEFARPNHLDGREALQAFLLLGATYMVPMHYDTFAHGVDEAGYALEVLRGAIARVPGTESAVRVLPIGGQLDVSPGRSGTRASPSLDGE
jgi:N-acyl-phosphatidylethanolamine-hydrolysing phospholipase D